jgi:hypothetical protein
LRENRKGAQNSAEHVTEIPEAAAWFARVDESRGIEHIEVLTTG